MRTLVLGTIRARRDGLRFEPHHAREVVAQAGDEVEIVVRFDYDEPSLAQDRFEAALRIDVPGAEPAQATRTLRDVPFRHDREQGVLSRRIVVHRPIEGRFELRAALGKGPWTRGLAELNGPRLEERGAFRVRVE